MNTSDVIVFDVINELWEGYKKVAARGRSMTSSENERMKKGLPFADSVDDDDSDTRNES